MLLLLHAAADTTAADTTAADTDRIKAYSVFKRLIFMKPNDGLREGLLEMKENNHGFEWIAKRRGKIFLKYKLYKILNEKQMGKDSDREDEINKNIVTWLDTLNISLDNIDKTVKQRRKYINEVMKKEKWKNV